MSPATMAARKALVAAGVLMLASASAGTQQKDLAPEASRLITILELRPGDSVADIGAGSGEMTVEVARQLGGASRVFSTDINAERLREIRDAAAAAQLSNIVVLEGHSDRTNLEDGCCDAIFVRHVYHHFGDPPAMNASIRRSLEPGGRFAVMDFRPKKPITGTVPPKMRSSGDTHGVTPETVMRELEAAGFEDLQLVRDWPGGLFLVLARNPK
jgi:SAM-dependent methyltransferase